jgi:hypothetical protein
MERGRAVCRPLFLPTVVLLSRLQRQTDKMAEQVRFLEPSLPAAALQDAADLYVLFADREGIPEAAGCEPWVSSSQHQCHGPAADERQV